MDYNNQQNYNQYNYNKDNKYNTNYENSTINNMYNTNAYIQTQQIQQPKNKKTKSIWKVILLILLLIIFTPCACSFYLLSNIKSVTIEEPDEGYNYSSINEEKIPANWVDETRKEIDIRKSSTKWGYCNVPNLKQMKK